MTSILEEIIKLLTAGIQNVGTAVGSGVQTIVKALFVTGEGTTESPYKLSLWGGIIITFAGISLAIGLCRKVYNYLVTMGGNK